LSGTNTLLNEARGLIERSRVALAETPAQNPTPNTKTNTTKEKVKIMSTELTAQRAGELYASGMSVIEVAREHNLTYSKVRKLIADSGTPIRDASSRLKGRTRKAGA
jgi:hypothetical protein